MPTNINRKSVIDTQPDIGVGIMLPLDNEDGGVFKLSYTTREQAISNLKNLLLTRQGERIMEPTFGTTIQDYLFQPRQNIQFENIRRAVKTAIHYWLPYIIVEQCEVSAYTPGGLDTADYGVLIYLLVRPTETGANVPISILYTTSTIQVSEQRLGGDSNRSPATAQNTIPR